MTGLPQGARLPAGWAEARRPEAEALWAAYLAETADGGQMLSGSNLEKFIKSNGLDGWIADVAALQARQDRLAETIEAERIRRASRQIMDAEERAAARDPIVLVPAAEVRKRKPPPFLVDGLIPAGPAIGVFFGETGTYKSFLVLDLMLCVGATSAAFLGHMVDGIGWSVYVMGEGQGDAGQRLDAAVTAHTGFTDERLAYIEQAFPLSDEAAVDEVITRCRELPKASGVPVLLVVFDSLADFYGAEDSESSSTDMQRLIASMKRIAAALGCVVMANAHTGHGGKTKDGDELPPPERLRGSSRFRQAWDFEMMATGRVLKPTKNRYGPLADPVAYEMTGHGGTLVVAAGVRAGASSAEPPPGWPDPCPLDAWAKVANTIANAPRQTMATIQKLSGVRREWVSVALQRGEAAGMFTNTGTKSRPAWAWGGPFLDWITEQEQQHPAQHE